MHIYITFKQFKSTVFTAIRVFKVHVVEVWEYTGGLVLILTYNLITLVIIEWENVGWGFGNGDGHF